MSGASNSRSKLMLTLALNRQLQDKLAFSRAPKLFTKIKDDTDYLPDNISSSDSLNYSGSDTDIPQSPKKKR